MLPVSRLDEKGEAAQISPERRRFGALSALYRKPISSAGRTQSSSHDLECWLNLNCGQFASVGKNPTIGASKAPNRGDQTKVGKLLLRGQPAIAGCPGRAERVGQESVAAETLRAAPLGALQICLSR